MYKRLDVRKGLDFSTATLEGKSNAFNMLKKIYFQPRIYIHSSYQSSKMTGYIHFQTYKISTSLSAMQFLKKLLEKELHQNQKVNQESKTGEMQDARHPAQVRVKGSSLEDGEEGYQDVMYITCRGVPVQTRVM